MIVFLPSQRIYLFKVNNQNTRSMCEVCSKLRINTLEWHCFGVFIVWTGSKKIPFLAKAWHWCVHLYLDCSKLDLSSWVIPSVPMVKLKNCSWYSHYFQSNFYDTSGTKMYISKMILFYILFELEKLWTWFCLTW